MTALPESGDVRARTALLSIAAFWLFYFAIATLRSAVLELDRPADLLGRRLIVTLASALVTVLVWQGLKRVRGGLAPSVAVAGLLSVPAALAYASVNYIVFAPVSPVGARLYLPSSAVTGGVQMGFEHREVALGPIKVIADSAANGLFCFVAWSALFLALRYAAEGQAAERRIARLRAATQTAELRALRYQVNPHFLFNTLNSLSTLVMTDRRDEAERMILNLSTFFRTSLTGEPSEDVSLGEEIALQRLYLEIEKVRFRDRLVAEIDVPDALLEARVPGLILQPLLENAIKHGVSSARRPVTIRVAARHDGNRLMLMVVDDGPPAEDPASGSGIGLRNVCDRLTARFGDGADCQWRTPPEGGFEVALAMPLLLS